jgi:hypothetical protein
MLQRQSWSDDTVHLLQLHCVALLVTSQPLHQEHVLRDAYVPGDDSQPSQFPLFPQRPHHEWHINHRPSGAQTSGGPSSVSEQHPSVLFNAAHSGCQGLQFCLEAPLITNQKCGCSLKSGSRERSFIKNYCFLF